MNVKAIALLALSIAALSGCASLISPSRTHELQPGRPYFFDFDATRRGAFMMPKDPSMKICAEPAPDVALDSITKIVAELKLVNPNIDAKTQVELQTKVVELAGRTQLVLVLRESLYRLCEQGVNGNLTHEQVTALYSQVLETVLKLAQVDLAKEQKAIIENLKDPELRKIFSGMLNSVSQ